ncbi:hypothetical protein MRB53_038397 [Persea americana]|nr:hypothetical protein MRB53_038397 [Persea americana]
MILRSAHTSSAPDTRLQQFGLLSSQSTGEQSSKRSDEPRGWRGRIDAAVLTFWSCVQLSVTFWLLTRAAAIALMQAATLPARSVPSSYGTKTLDDPPGEPGIIDDRPESPENLPTHSAAGKPMISMRVWACVSHLMSLERRMPWLAGSLSLVQWISLYGPGRICRLNSRLDRCGGTRVLFGPTPRCPVLDRPTRPIVHWDWTYCPTTFVDCALRGLPGGVARLIKAKWGKDELQLRFRSLYCPPSSDDGSSLHARLHLQRLDHLAWPPQEGYIARSHCQPSATDRL